MNAAQHETVNAMLGEYALGQLSAEERRTVDAHLAECVTCRSELREYQQLMDALASTPEPVAPPPGLRGKVLADAAAALPRARGRSMGDWRVWSLAAAAMLVVAVGASMFVAEQRRRDAELRATILGLENRLATFTGQTDLALSILTASDMQPIGLAGRDDAVGSAARAYWSPTRGLLVVADQLPMPPPGRIYQVWVIGTGAPPVSAGLLGAQGAGRGMLIVPPPTGIAPGAVTVAVTDEPPGGLAAPTGAMRLLGSI